MSRLRNLFTPFVLSFQFKLFSRVEEELGPMPDKLKQLVELLEVIRIEQYLPKSFCVVGRRPKDRKAIARAYIAKAFYNLPTTRSLLDRIQSDEQLRRICGWERRQDVPSESAFSRAFAEFATMQLPSIGHDALVRETCGDRIIGHISRDSTAIEAREKPVFSAVEKACDQQDISCQPQLQLPLGLPTATQVLTPVSTITPDSHTDSSVTSSAASIGNSTQQNEKPKRGKRGRPRKGEEPPPKEPTRLQRQLTQSLPEILDDLPNLCDVGTKKNSKGKRESWIGYKLHIDTADGQIPTSCILTSASVHDSQVAIPLAKLTAQRVVNLYDLMDSAYDAKEIKEHSLSLNHVPIIDLNPRQTALKQEIDAEKKRRKLIGIQSAEEIRYQERTASERVNSRLKDEFGGRNLRVRGPLKAMCHCMFGILVLTADQLLRFVR